MSNLIDPRNQAPANDAQRGALCAAYALLGGSARLRRRGRARTVSIDRFHAGGLDRDLLCWLFFQAHLNHFHKGKRGRAAPYAVVGVVAAPDSCFTLTDAGHAFATRLLAPGLACNQITLPIGRLAPRYQYLARVLTRGVHVLKRYRQPSGNQELVLCAAEELEWPHWFDDPLPRVRGTCATRRAHDTIKALNQRQNPYLVHFKGNGKGTGVGWELR